MGATVTDVTAGSHSLSPTGKLSVPSTDVVRPVGKHQLFASGQTKETTVAR
jgi:hypothetical protein